MGYVFFLMLFSFQVFAVSGETLARLRKLYPDQDESFLLKRLSRSHTTFERLRDFPPYYYDLVDRVVKLPVRRGFCAGDAHYENFGFLYGRIPFFGLNDLDDSAPCNVNTDTLRLLVAHRLLFSDLNSSLWVENYEKGLRGEEKSLPPELARLRDQSLAQGRSLSNKYQKSWDSRSCREDLVSASEEDTAFLRQYSSGGTLVFACTRTKDTGGSAGLRRIIGFFLSPDLEVREFKPLKTPAPLYDQTLSISGRSAIFRDALRIFFRDIPDVSLQLTSRGPYQKRLLIAGNVSVEIKNGLSREIAYHEAFTLGKLHRENSRKLTAIDWTGLSDQVIKTFEREFSP